MARIIAIMSLVSLAALTSCSSEEVQCNGVLIGNTCYPAESGCQSDQECLPTGICLNGTCGQECTSDAGCLNGYTCQTYRCVLETNPGADTVDPPEDILQDAGGAIPCLNHLDCDPYDMACIEGFCGQECTQDWHCDDDGLVCQHYQCIPVEPPPDVGDCPPKDGAYGDPCECKEQCATQLCTINNLTGQTACTQYCTGDINCPGIDICVLVDPDPQPAGISICAYNDAGVTPPSCDANQAGCLKGLVLNNALGQCVCSVPCINAADSCPANMACHSQQNPNMKYCVSVGNACSTVENPCYSGSCLGDGNTGYCTALCLSTADCPAGWSCQAVEGGNACVAP